MYNQFLVNYVILLFSFYLFVQHIHFTYVLYNRGGEFFD